MTSEQMMKTITKERKQQKISQDKLANMIGVSRTAVLKWSKGAYYPTITDYCKMCEALGLTIIVVNTNQ